MNKETINKNIMEYLANNYGLLSNLVARTYYDSKNHLDLCQDVYIRACRRINNNQHVICYNDNGDIDKINYLPVIIKSVTIDCLRANNDLKINKCEYVDNLSHSSDTTTIASDDIYILSVLDTKLDSKSASILKQYYIDGYTQKELAVMYGMSQAGIADRLKKSILKLQSIYCV